jgi:hypothetical protein
MKALQKRKNLWGKQSGRRKRSILEAWLPFQKCSWLSSHFFRRKFSYCIQTSNNLPPVLNTLEDKSPSSVFMETRNKHLIFIHTSKQTQGPESANELYRPSDHLFSPKLVPTITDRGCCVARRIPYGCILGFIDRGPYFLFQVVP